MNFIRAAGRVEPNPLIGSVAQFDRELRDLPDKFISHGLAVSESSGHVASSLAVVS